MTPSKENCIKALSAVERLKSYLRLGHNLEDAQFVGDFLASAAKRLPREAALEKDRKRVRTKKT